MKYSLPFIIFTLVAMFLARGLYLDPQEIPSPLLDQPIPDLDLPALSDNDQRIVSSQLRGKPFLLNVFASWCAPCLEEHEYLMELASSGLISIYGLNYKDVSTNALEWLEKNGNPYTQIAVDSSGKAGIDLGVYGVPETFFVDAKGVIRFKYVGPLNRQVIREEILSRLGDK